MHDSTYIIHQGLKIGHVTTISPEGASVALSRTDSTSATYLGSGRYGCGEVGELVIVEGQTNLVLGKVVNVKSYTQSYQESLNNSINQEPLLTDLSAFVQVLASICPSTLKVSAGVSIYPRLGDAVYSAPDSFISKIPELMSKAQPTYAGKTVTLGRAQGSHQSKVKVEPDKLFARHCGVLGATGGGKSWTTAHLIQECAKFDKSKVIVIDPTGEYSKLPIAYTEHFHLGEPLNASEQSKPFYIPPTDFTESDFIAMFEPSGKVQGPKLREAIKSLRLVQLDPSLDTNGSGILEKENQSKEAYRKSLNGIDPSTGIKRMALVDNPSQPFEVHNITRQIVQECVNNFDTKKWGAKNDNELTYCASLFTRLSTIQSSAAFKDVFQPKQSALALEECINRFMHDPSKRVLRLCVSSTSYEFNARGLLANVIGRKLLTKAKEHAFVSRPLLTVLDEAHNFLGKRVGTEDHAVSLDAFELIAKEGRKYGLSICIATQRPRDITEGVISQLGTLIVHRLANHNDRELVERACGDVDRSMLGFLPNLQQGEAAVLGTDFPVPFIIKMDKPVVKPLSSTPNYQQLWS